MRWIGLLVLIGCGAEGTDGRDVSQETQDTVEAHDEVDVDAEVALEPVVSLTIVDIGRRSLGPEAGPATIAEVEIYNGISAGVVVMASALRAIYVDTPIERPAEPLMFQADTCPEAPVVLSPGATLRCRVLIAGDAEVAKVVLVTTSEDAENPSVRAEAVVKNFVRCEECHGTCMPMRTGDCGVCGTACERPQGGDAVCFGGQASRLLRFDASGETRFEYTRFDVACVAWRAIEKGSDVTCTERCVADGLACIDAYGNGVSSSEPLGDLSVEPWGEQSDSTQAPVSLRCDGGVPANYERVWCSCHPAQTL